MNTDTKAVARYRVILSHGLIEVEAHPAGSLVLFTDHERVVGELERLVANVETENDYLRTTLAASRAEVEGLREAGVSLSVAHPGMVRELRRMSKRLDGEPVWIEPAEANLLLKLVDAAMEKGNV